MPATALVDAVLRLGLLTSPAMGYMLTPRAGQLSMPARAWRPCAPAALAGGGEDAEDASAEAALREMMAKAAAPSASDIRLAEAIADWSGERAKRAADARATDLFAKARARADLDSTTSVEAELAVEAQACAARAKAAAARKRLARDSESVARVAGSERTARIYEYDRLGAMREEIEAVEDELSMLRAQDEPLTRPINVLLKQLEGAQLAVNATARRAYTRRLAATRALVTLEDEAERRRMRQALARYEGLVRAL